MTTSRSEARARRLRGVAALVAALAGPGCTYTVRLLSDPSGATVTWRDEGQVREQVITPAQLTVPRPAAGHVWLTVEAPGYRPLMVDLQRTEGPVLRYLGAATLQRGGREVMFVLEPDRPPVGGE